MNDEELVQAWIEAESALHDAYITKRSADQEQVRALNKWNEAKKVEAAAWQALETHRIKVVDGRV